MEMDLLRMEIGSILTEAEMLLKIVCEERRDGPRSPTLSLTQRA